LIKDHEGPKHVGDKVKTIRDLSPKYSVFVLNFKDLTVLCYCNLVYSYKYKTALNEARKESV